MVKHDFVPEFVLDNAAEDAEQFFQMIRGKYNTDVQASIIMLLVSLISENSNIPINDLWASLVVAAASANRFNKKHERRNRKKT